MRDTKEPTLRTSFASLTRAMDSYREARRRLLAILLASVVTGAGCSAPEPLDTTTTAAADQRREQIRDRLRSSLGDRYDAPLPAGTCE